MWSHKTVIACIMVVVMSFSAFTTPVFATNDHAWIEKAKMAVGILYSQQEDGGMRMHCTSTAFDKTENGYLFVTAAHCIGSDDSTKEHSANPYSKSFFISFDETGSNAKKFWPASPIFVGYQSRGEDFAVFKVLSNESWPTIALGNESTLSDGAQYWNVASPLGLGRQIQEGIISNMSLDRPIMSGNINWKGTLVLQQAGVGGGSSGSPLISKEQKKIVGFLVGTIGSNTIVAIPVSRFLAVQNAVAKDAYKYWKAVRDNSQDLNPDGSAKKPQ